MCKRCNVRKWLYRTKCDNDLHCRGISSSTSLPRCKAKGNSLRFNVIPTPIPYKEQLVCESYNESTKRDYEFLAFPKPKIQEQKKLMDLTVCLSVPTWAANWLPVQVRTFIRLAEFYTPASRASSLSAIGLHSPNARFSPKS